MKIRNSTIGGPAGGQTAASWLCQRNLAPLRLLFVGLFAAACLNSRQTLGQSESGKAESDRRCGPSITIRTIDGSTENVRFVRGSLMLTGHRQLRSSMRLDFDATTYLSRGWSPVTIATLRTGEVLPGYWSLVNRGAGGIHMESTLFGELPEAWAAASSWRSNRFSPFQLPRLTPQPPLPPPPLPRNAVSAASSSSRPITSLPLGFASVRLPTGCADSAPLDAERHPEHQWRLVTSRPVSIAEPFKGSVAESERYSPAGSNVETRFKSDPELRRRQTVELPVPLKDGMLVWGMSWPILRSRFEAPPPGRHEFVLDDATLRFLFRTADGNVQSLEVSAGWKQISVRLPDGRSSHLKVVPPIPLYSVIRVTLNDGLSLSVNDASIARMNSVPGQLFALEVEGAFAARGDTKAQQDSLPSLEQPWVRHVDRSAVEVRRGGNSMRHSFDVDRVILTSGDELFGQITQAAGTVTLRDARATGHVRQIDRGDIQAITFRRSNEFSPRTVDGFFCQIELVPDSSCSLAAIEEPFWMRTAILHAEQDGLLTAHPILGKVFVRWSMIRQIRPLFQGSYTLIDPGPRHLGNGYRESFSRVEPDGTKLSLDFVLEKQQLEDSVFLSGDVAELIPSGPDTLRATPFLDDVRAGFLTTQVLLNGERVGPLNGLISVRSLARAPERVRFRLPARLLKEGGNTIRLQQTSAKDDADSFDDCEIRSLAIEVERSVQ